MSAEPIASENRPRVFGALLGLFGLALASAGLYAIVIDGSRDFYFVTIGAGYAFCGILFFRGRPSAIALSTLLLLVVWVWSLKEVGLSNSSGLFMRVGMPTILAAYILFSDLSARLQPEEPPELRRLTEQEERLVDRATDTAFSAATLAVKVLVLVVLAYAAKNSLGILSHLAAKAPSLWNVFRILWITLPYAALGWLLFTAKRFDIGDWSLLFVSIITALFGMGAYSMIPDQPSIPDDTSALTWVPFAQFVWGGICLYVVSTRFPSNR